MYMHCLLVVLIIYIAFINGYLSVQDITEESVPAISRDEKYSILCWFPVPIKSHQRFVEPLLRELAERGHQVTFVTPMPLSHSPDNLYQVTVKNQYELWHTIMKSQGWLDKINPLRVINSIESYKRSIFEDPVVQEFLSQDRKFDGIIMESMIMNEPFIGLHHKYKAPVVEMVPVPSYHWIFFNVGTPYDTSYIADMVMPCTDRMTFMDRLKNTFISLAFRAIGSFLLNPASEDMMNRYLRYPGWEERPRISEMLSNISLVLLNAHFSLTYPYPLAPHTKEIAGINMASPQPLPKDFIQFMDSSHNGVIVFSFGSHFNMTEKLGTEEINIFIKYFKTLKQKVLWKWDGENVPDVPSNVKLTKWFPQTDILAHKNCRLFITHGGFHSSIEAIYNSIPVVAIPLQEEQMRNSKMLSYHGVGLILTLDNITEETLSWTVNQVLNDNIYKENSRRRSLIYRDSKFSPLKTAVYWTEYVLRHKGAPHLKPALASMPWYQQAMLDVYAAMFVTVITALYIVYILVKFVIKIFMCFYRGCNKNKDKNE